MDEIAELVAQVQDDEVEEPEPEIHENETVEGAAPAPAPEPAPKPKRSRAKKNGEKTMEELDAGFGFLEGRTLPKPAENVKTLGDMYEKYRVGVDPDFKVQVFRTYPKMYKGKKFDGFYDTWDIPMSLEQLQAEYGGGQYRVRVVGPHPSNPNMTTKHYDSIAVSIAGDPRWERIPRSAQGKEGDPNQAGAMTYQMPPAAAAPAENPKLAETALKMMQDTAESERSERRRIEDREEERRRTASDGLTPVIEAERRRSDDVIKAERERAESERRMLQERLHEERARAEEETSRLRHRVDSLGSNQRSIGEELASLASAGLFNRDDGGAAKEMLTQILEKHRGEMSAVQQSHTAFVEALRMGHASEIVAIRDAHRSEVAAEREASRSREGRIDERLQSEREERRRDQDRHREQIEQRDTQWKDRMEQAQSTMQSSWESRHQALVSTYENRIQWLQQEVDRVKSELFDQRAKQEEKGDVLTQLSKMSEMQAVIKQISGVEGSTPAATASTGGIGLSGGDDWKSTLVEGLGDRLPAILGALTGGGAAPQQAAAQQAPQYQEGQVVDTPNGPMVVVRDPSSGQLALAPKEAFEAHQKAVAAQQAKGGGMLPPDSRSAQPRRRKPVSAVPNLAQGLPKRRPPWEGGGDRPERAAPPPPPPEAPRRMTTQAKVEHPLPSEPIEMSNVERQVVKLVAKEIHTSVMDADDPEEFVTKMMNSYDSNILKQIVGGYTTAQIAQGVAQVEPGSAGATPGGQQFIAEAFALLRDALR
jgi:hypothetical protein